MIWILLAVLLLAVAAVLIVTAAVEWSAAVEVDVLGFSAETTLAGVFFTGAVTGLLVLGGVAASLVGIQQVLAHRREIEYLRQRVAEQDRLASIAGTGGGATVPQRGKDPQAGKNPQSAEGPDQGKGEAAMAGTSRREKRRTDRSADVS